MYRTPEENKKYYIESMGKELGNLFYVISNEVEWLYVKWGNYVELFGKKPSRIDLLNNAAPSFFGIVEKTLFKDTIIHITRLTDPERSVGKDNLTINRLPNLVVEKLKSNVENLTKIACEKAEFCKDWRHRRIAHTDLKLALKKGAEPLKPASRAKMREAMEAIAAVVNSVANHYLGSTIYFDGVLSGVFDAKSLLLTIQYGLKAQKAEQERIEAGDYPDPYEIDDI